MESTKIYLLLKQTNKIKVWRTEETQTEDGEVIPTSMCQPTFAGIWKNLQMLQSLYEGHVSSFLAFLFNGLFLFKLWAKQLVYEIWKKSTTFANVKVHWQCKFSCTHSTQSHWDCYI